MSAESRQDLPSLVGEELSGICFVRDYLELHFDGPILRMLGKVSIRTPELSNCLHILPCADDRSLKLLLGAIGRKVDQVNFSNFNVFEIRLENGMTLTVNPSRPGAEYVHFLSFPDKRLTIVNGE